MAVSKDQTTGGSNLYAVAQKYGLYEVRQSGAGVQPKMFIEALYTSKPLAEAAIEDYKRVVNRKKRRYYKRKDV